jgi:hypothetical protein
MKTIKYLLVSFFNVCFPPNNENDIPKTYELVFFYIVMGAIVLAVIFIFLGIYYLTFNS